MIFLLTATTRFSVSVLSWLPKTWENFSRVLSYPRGGARYCLDVSFFRDRDGMVEELRDMSGCRSGMPLKFAVSAGLASIAAWFAVVVLLYETLVCTCAFNPELVVS